MRLAWIVGIGGVMAAAATLGCSGSAAAPGDGNTPPTSTVDSGTSTPGSQQQDGQLPCGVSQVLSEHCAACHSNPPQFGAPMPLVTFADLHAIAPADPSTAGTNVPVCTAVEQRIHDTKSPMPQSPNPLLDAADLATLDSWIAAGAPAAAAGDSCSNDAGTTSDSGAITTLSCTPDTILAPTSAWSMPADLEDQYVCYGFDVTVGAKRQVIGFEPQVQNHAIVHHALIYQSETAYSSTPTPCPGGGIPGGRIIFGWAPGGQPLSMPSNVGFPEDAGTTHYVVQIHYNNINHLAGQTDTSGFALCTTDQLRQYDADVIAFGTTTIDIPAHATLDDTCIFTLPAGLPTLTAFDAMPHMHELGTTISTVDLAGGNGAPVNLGQVPAWNFQNQVFQPIDATMNSGDMIKTRCAWDNTTNDAVTYGPYTEDEMCFSFTMYYPRVTTWSWSYPATQSTCAPTQ